MIFEKTTSVVLPAYNCLKTLLKVYVEISVFKMFRCIKNFYYILLLISASLLYQLAIGCEKCIICLPFENGDNFVLITENILLCQLISNDEFTICNISQFDNINQMFCRKTNFILINDDTIDYLKEQYGTILNLYSINPVLVLKNIKLYEINLDKSSSSIDDNLKAERRCIMS
jgi:hypothetical protein